MKFSKTQEGYTTTRFDGQVINISKTPYGGILTKWITQYKGDDQGIYTSYGRTKKELVELENRIEDDLKLKTSFEAILDEVITCKHGDGVDCEQFFIDQGVAQDVAQYCYIAKLKGVEWELLYDDAFMHGGYNKDYHLSEIKSAIKHLKSFG